MDGVGNGVGVSNANGTDVTAIRVFVGVGVKVVMFGVQVGGNRDGVCDGWGVILDD